MDRSAKKFKDGGDFVLSLCSLVSIIRIRSGMTPIKCQGIVIFSQCPISVRLCHRIPVPVSE